MIRHILLFSLKEGATSEDRQAMLDELSGFPRLFPQIQNWQMGENSSSRDDMYEYGVTMEFSEREYLNRYLTSDEHERFVREKFRPLISSRAIVSFDVA
ncbi:MAG: Dabb family protein [Sphingobium sp.]|nr:Dabb family protein [Sphingobium sp.]